MWLGTPSASKRVRESLRLGEIGLQRRLWGSSYRIFQPACKARVNGASFFSKSCLRAYFPDTRVTVEMRRLEDERRGKIAEGRLEERLARCLLDLRASCLTACAAPMSAKGVVRRVVGDGTCSAGAPCPAPGCHPVRKRDATDSASHSCRHQCLEIEIRLENWQKYWTNQIGIRVGPV